MPVSNEDRAAYAKLSDADKAGAVQTQLKFIREGSTGPGVMDHVAINNALDHIEVLTTKAPVKAEIKPVGSAPYIPSPPVQPTVGFEPPTDRVY